MMLENCYDRCWGMRIHTYVGVDPINYRQLPIFGKSPCSRTCGGLHPLCWLVLGAKLDLWPQAEVNHESRTANYGLSCVGFPSSTHEWGELWLVEAGILMILPRYDKMYRTLCRMASHHGEKPRKTSGWTVVSLMLESRCRCHGNFRGLGKKG